MILEYEARLERLQAECSKTDTSMVILTCHMKVKCPPDEVGLAARLLKGPFTITMTSMQADFFKDVDKKDGQISLDQAVHVENYPDMWTQESEDKAEAEAATDVAQG